MTLNCDIIKDNDMNLIITAEVDRIGFKDSLRSYNDFIKNGIKRIITDLFSIELVIPNTRKNTEEDVKIKEIKIQGKFDDVTLQKPMKINKAGVSEPIYPYEVRMGKGNYEALMFAKVNITATAIYHDGNTKDISGSANIDIGKIPVMIKSSLCHLDGLPANILKEKREDPQDLGMYCIYDSVEYFISISESRAFNVPNIQKNIGHKNEIIRLNYISRLGDAYDHSYEIIIRYTTDREININFTSIKYLKELKIPFFILFRLLGMTVDKEIFDNIVYGYEDALSVNMINVIKDAFEAPMGIFEPLRYIYDSTMLETKLTDILITDYVGRFSEPGEFIKKSLLDAMKNKFFPHIGKLATDNITKLRFFGYLIRRMLLVNMGVNKSSDWDHLKNRRMYDVGIILSKAYKLLFNNNIMIPMKKVIKKEFETNPFSSVSIADLIRKSVRTNKLAESIKKAIVSDKDKKKLVSGRMLNNTIKTERVDRKNNMNYMSIIGTTRPLYDSGQKQTERSIEMRSVHPSYAGYICCTQTPDNGRMVGINKQKAISASISLSNVSALLLESILAKDADLIRYENTYPLMIYKRNMCIVFIDGKPTFCVAKNPDLIIKRYREYRRRIYLKDYKTFEHLDISGINIHTTIARDFTLNEIQFHTDVGRLLRPLVIVRNNGEFDPVGRKHFESLGFKPYDPYKDEGFVQDIMITNEIIAKLKRKEIRIEHLVDLGMIDYISPGEMENCKIARDLSQLREDRHNVLNQYTHVEIPIAILGLMALHGPVGNQNAVTREIFASIQAKQTASIPFLNHPYQATVHSHISLYNDIPVTPTIANKYVFPTGSNAIVAIGCDMGMNQDDSLICNRSSMKRGLFKVISFNTEQIMLEETGSKFASPDITDTSDIKRNANYDLLDNGYIKRGTEIKQNDVIAGKLIEKDDSWNASLADSHRKYKDASLIYRSREKAYVEDVIEGENSKHIKYMKIKLSSERVVGIGEKFSSRHGQKGMTGLARDECDMPYTESGLIPDLILNPHAFPTRMTIGQIIEGNVAKLAVHHGTMMDMTTFKRVDIDEIGKKLEEIGFYANGKERMYDGKTGRWIDALIFISPIYYQRLQKFAVEELYAINKGPICALTRQPLNGRQKNGGLRLGEMEKDVLFSHGAVRYLMEKFTDDSDGFDIYVCETCGSMPVVNEDKSMSYCVTCYACGKIPKIYKIRSSYTSKLFIQEMESAGIKVRLVPRMKIREY